MIKPPLNLLGLNIPQSLLVENRTDAPGDFRVAWRQSPDLRPTPLVKRSVEFQQAQG